jgi:serine/threonine-protein kinase
MSADELVKLALHISEAISAIWQFSKVHRDIKPGNIMRRASDGEYILLDMGLVFDLGDLSLSVTPVGTPHYFSPEQMDFDHRRTVLSFRSDLFSLGIVMYEMATGTHPFVTPATRTTRDVVGNILRLTPTPPNAVRPDLPQSLNDTMLRLLAKRPALRFRSIALFQRALGVGTGGGGTA